MCINCLVWCFIICKTRAMLVSVSCGQTTQENVTYIVGGDDVMDYEGCHYQLCRCTTDVCRVKLEFNVSYFGRYYYSVGAECEFILTLQFCIQTRIVFYLQTFSIGQPAIGIAYKTADKANADEPRPTRHTAARPAVSNFSPLLKLA